MKKNRFSIIILFLIFFSFSLIGQEDNNEEDKIDIEEVVIEFDSDEEIEIEFSVIEDEFITDYFRLNENFIESNEQLDINIFSFKYDYNKFWIQFFYGYKNYHNININYSDSIDDLLFIINLDYNSFDYDLYSDLFNLSFETFYNKNYNFYNYAEIIVNSYQNRNLVEESLSFQYKGYYDNKNLLFKYSNNFLKSEDSFYVDLTYEISFLINKNFGASSFIDILNFNSNKYFLGLFYKNQRNNLSFYISSHFGYFIDNLNYLYEFEMIYNIKSSNLITIGVAHEYSFINDLLKINYLYFDTNNYNLYHKIYLGYEIVDSDNIFNIELIYKYYDKHIYLNSIDNTLHIQNSNENQDLLINVNYLNYFTNMISLKIENKLLINIENIKFNNNKLVVGIDITPDFVINYIDFNYKINIVYIEELDLFNNFNLNFGYDGVVLDVDFKLSYFPNGEYYYGLIRPNKFIMYAGIKIIF